MNQATVLYLRTTTQNPSERTEIPVNPRSGITFYEGFSAFCGEFRFEYLRNHSDRVEILADCLMSGMISLLGEYTRHQFKKGDIRCKDNNVCLPILGIGREERVFAIRYDNEKKNTGRVCFYGFPSCIKPDELAHATANYWVENYLN